MVNVKTSNGKIKWQNPNTVNMFRDLIRPNLVYLSHECVNYLNTPDDIDRIIDELVGTLVDAGKKLPHSKYRKNVKPFWNAQLTQLKKQKVDCHRMWKAAGRPRSDDNILYINHKAARKAFLSELKRVQRDHDKKEVDNIIYAAMRDKGKFWKRIKRIRNPTQSEVFAIRNEHDTVVYEINEVVEVWRKHFARISQPRVSDTFDDNHFKHVTAKVNEWSNEADDDVFLSHNYLENEIFEGLKVLKIGKSPGFDGLTTEHLIHAGEPITTILTYIFNSIITSEYIPVNLRRGTQIPLYKGKNSCPLDVNNYRGITLLSSMNKLFEILVWNRVKVWWSDERVISLLQGACRQGSSCLHSALILQEGIAARLDANKKVFVVYFDAAKAFDSVWTDGLFYQLRKMGVTGKIWRLLYKSYHDFRCKVRLCGS